jgi:hypothetical protein
MSGRVCAPIGQVASARAAKPVKINVEGRMGVGVGVVVGPRANDRSNESRDPYVERRSKDRCPVPAARYPKQKAESWEPCTYGYRVPGHRYRIRAYIVSYNTVASGLHQPISAGSVNEVQERCSIALSLGPHGGQNFLPGGLRI